MSSLKTEAHMTGLPLATLGAPGRHVHVHHRVLLDGVLILKPTKSLPDSQPQGPKGSTNTLKYDMYRVSVARTVVIKLGGGRYFASEYLGRIRERDCRKEDGEGVIGLYLTCSVIWRN